MMITWWLIALVVSAVVSGMWSGFVDFVRNTVVGVMEKLKSFLHKVFVGSQCFIRKVGGFIYKVVKNIVYDTKRGQVEKFPEELQPLSPEEISNLDENTKKRIQQLREGQSIDVTKEVELEMRNSV